MKIVLPSSKIDSLLLKKTLFHQRNLSIESDDHKFGNLQELIFFYEIENF